MTIKTLIVPIALLSVALVVCSPLLTIWELNTLFAVGIPYTFKTWLATFLLETSLVIIAGSKRK